MTQDTAMPLENFIQAVQNQLDKAQSAMAVKARNLNLPMTFAIKDITLDLRAHVEFDQGEIRIRPAGPEQTDASVFHLVFTGITRPMIEENAAAFSEDSADQPIDELDEDLSDEDRRKLEWVGVRTVEKLRELDREGASNAVGRVTNLPVSRLRKALARAASPWIDQIVPHESNDHTASPGASDAPPRRFLRVNGRNLLPNNRAPRVRIDGRPVAIVKSSDRELLIAPEADQWRGELNLDGDGEHATSMSFDLEPFAPPSNVPPPPPATNGNAHDGASR